MGLIYLLKAIKMVCKAHPNCEECDFHREGTTCCLFDELPEYWDLKEIQKALEKE